MHLDMVLRFRQRHWQVVCGDKKAACCFAVMNGSLIYGLLFSAWR